MYRTERWYLPILAVFAVVLLGAWATLAVDRATRVAALNEIREESSNDAAILAAGLESELNKFSLVPRVLAVDPEVAALLAGDRSQQAVLNSRLAALAKQTDAAAIYIMNADGLTLAASNWNRPDSFVGSNYGFRDYFSGAIGEGAFTEFALGTVSRRPGLYISERVNTAAGSLGVVAVKVEFDDLERKWRDAKGGVFVTDSDGVVLLASDPDWRFRATANQPTSPRDPERDATRFGIAKLAPLTLPASQGATAPFAMIENIQPIAPLAWELHLLSDPGPRLNAAITNGRLLVLLGVMLLVIAGSAVLVWLRRRLARASAALSEQTAMLREQLHQANRLATLGQVTAGLSHEIRQPLAAMQVYAESGERLLAAGRNVEAAGNFSKIAGLAVKIGQITVESLQFSRRAPREPKEIALAEVIDGSLLLLSDQIRRRKIRLSLPDHAQVRVRAQHVQLEQVLVNLIQNAIQACDEGGKITISVALGPDQCRLMVEDDGPGVPADIREVLFQPFVTTKPDGIGLGLVIARDIMREHGGDLMLENPGRGTCFTITIPVA
ncbi:ATP-binding protein [Blastomonas sp.]|uniref:sensor histidine kinase n=1 Tax=Blastomonas sp. TaxID=1909299 RepID=UPI00359447EE